MAAFAAVDIAGATDTETQSDVSGSTTQMTTLSKRRALVGVLSALGVTAAAGLAISASTAAPKANWSSLTSISKEGTHTITKDTGCSDWKSQMAIPMTTATSDLDCLNKCLVVAGAKYANYQDDHCDSDINGAEKGACYCFKDCAKVQNSCWDLIDVSVGTPGESTSIAATTAASTTAATTTSTTAYR